MLCNRLRSNTTRDNVYCKSILIKAQLLLYIYIREMMSVWCDSIDVRLQRERSGLFMAAVRGFDPVTSPLHGESQASHHSAHYPT